MREVILIKSKTLNEFLNIKNIDEKFLYTLDNQVISFIKVYPVNNELFSEEELENKMDSMSVDFSNEQYPYSVFIIPRRVDITDYIKEQEELKKNIQDEISIKIVEKRMIETHNMVADKNIIENDKFLSLLREELKGVEAYLAGGYIRDLALSYQSKATSNSNLTQENGELTNEEPVSHDRDIVLFNCNTENVARNLANSIGAAFVELDAENKIYRVVSGDDYADIAQGLNNNVDDDIDRRDFTINSIFYNLQNGEFYDKNRGLEDIEAKIIKTKDLKNLSDEPLRMFRAFRFKSKTGFKINDDVIKFTI